MSYLSTLSIYDSVVVILYVVCFGMFWRIGSHMADWVIEGYRWFFSRLLSRLTVHCQGKK